MGRSALGGSANTVRLTAAHRHNDFLNAGFLWPHTAVLTASITSHLMSTSLLVFFQPPFIWLTDEFLCLQQTITERQKIGNKIWRTRKYIRNIFFTVYFIRCVVRKYFYCLLVICNCYITVWIKGTKPLSLSIVHVPSHESFCNFSVSRKWVLEGTS